MECCCDLSPRSELCSLQFNRSLSARTAQSTNHKHDVMPFQLFIWSHVLYCTVVDLPTLTCPSTRPNSLPLTTAAMQSKVRVAPCSSKTRVQYSTALTGIPCRVRYCMHLMRPVSTRNNVQNRTQRFLERLTTPHVNAFEMQPEWIRPVSLVQYSTSRYSKHSPSSLPTVEFVRDSSTCLFVWPILQNNFSSKYTVSWRAHSWKNERNMWKMFSPFSWAPQSGSVFC